MLRQIPQNTTNITLILNKNNWRIMKQEESYEKTILQQKIVNIVLKFEGKKVEFPFQFLSKISNAKIVTDLNISE